jgi:hypothetical protein
MAAAHMTSAEILLNDLSNAPDLSRKPTKRPISAKVKNQAQDTITQANVKASLAYP